ncbi:class I SAM-dependent methyltransferase [Candidatus Methylomirabilis sp.]|uniref:class I SAM-dependent methyltransferase n=1 Tax=Candidatus Methylomirabilis sp. TaxID=2032687 RepID=UPI002A628AEE|nr:class I SAM-dependent methyltransferase [Candidatus Methylomirabilis sp.]
MNPILEIGKQWFYRYYPSAFVSAYIRALYLKKYVRTIAFSKVLDAGCGSGLFTLFLAERFPQARFTGYDLSEEHIRESQEEASRKGLKNVSFCVEDLVSLHEREKYDFVFSIDCLEHIPGNQQVITNLVNALEPGGVLYLAIPCEKIHRYLFPSRYFETYTCWASKEHIGDQYTREELVALLRSLGVEILHARYAFGFWGKLAWELDMLTDGKTGLKRLLLPFLFCIGALDPLFSNTSGPYGVVVIGRKPLRAKTAARGACGISPC